MQGGLGSLSIINLVPSFYDRLPDASASTSHQDWSLRGKRLVDRHAYRSALSVACQARRRRCRSVAVTAAILLRMPHTGRYGKSVGRGRCPPGGPPMAGVATRCRCQPKLHLDRGCAGSDSGPQQEYIRCRIDLGQTLINTDIRASITLLLQRISDPRRNYVRR